MSHFEMELIKKISLKLDLRNLNTHGPNQQVCLVLLAGKFFLGRQLRRDTHYYRCGRYHPLSLGTTQRLTY